MRRRFRDWLAENWLWIAVPAVVAIAVLGYLILTGEDPNDRGYPLY